MRNIIWMREKRQEMLDQADAILRAAASDGRQYITTAERDEQEALVAKAKALEAEIAEEEEFQGKALRGEVPTISPEEWAGVPEARGSRPNCGPGKSFRSLFGEPTNSYGWQSKEDFLNAAFSSRHDPRLTEKRQHLGSDNELGGFSMPEQLTSWLLDRTLEESIVLPKASVYGMEARTRRVPAWAGESRVGEYEEPFQLYGGFVPIWMEEAEAQTDQTATLRQITLTAYKLGIFSSVSNELAMDGLDFTYQLEQAMKKAVSWTLDYYFLRGSGTNQPQGVLECPSLITVDREGAGITWNDIVNMYGRLHPVACKNAVWICNFEAIPQLMTMTDGADHLVWHPTGSMRVPNTLLGLEVIRTEKTPGLNQTGDIILADLSHYIVGMRRDMSLDVSQAPGWHSDLASYRVLMRLDGRDSWASEVTPAEGDSTLSWCVALGSQYES